jgi:hypothetical protein
MGAAYVPDLDAVRERTLAERAAQGLPPTIQDPVICAGARRCRARMTVAEALEHRGAA